MKLGNIVDKRFSDAMAKLGNQKIPLKTAFKLKTILKLAQAEATKYDEIRTDICERYGSRDEKGELMSDEKGNVKLEGGNLEQWTKEIQELIDLDIEFPVIKLSELGDEVGNLTMFDLMLLDFITE